MLVQPSPSNQILRHRVPDDVGGARHCKIDRFAVATVLPLTVLPGPAFMPASETATWLPLTVSQSQL